MDGLIKSGHDEGEVPTSVPAIKVNKRFKLPLAV
jgi:hypothetical protein